MPRITGIKADTVCAKTTYYVDFTLLATNCSDSKMPWPWQSGSSSALPKRDNDEKPSIMPFSLDDSKTQQKPTNLNDWFINVEPFKDPRTWVPAFAITTVLFGGIKFYRIFVRRIRSVEYIHPDSYHKRSLYGKVTSVGDGDGFHLFHTPGGRWAGWGWLRKVPTDRKLLKGNTVGDHSVRVPAPGNRLLTPLLFVN